MVQDAERIGEVERVVFEGQRVDARVVQNDVVVAVELRAGHLKRLLAGIHAMQLGDVSARYELRPPSAAAANIGAPRSFRERFPGKDRKIFFE